jgi:hypothetical protein
MFLAVFLPDQSNPVPKLRVLHFDVDIVNRAKALRIQTADQVSKVNGMAKTGNKALRLVITNQGKKKPTKIARATKAIKPPVDPK